ncbi:MAG: hypothetical protein WD825_16585 [Gemmatimonadaceae bacterium]
MPLVVLLFAAACFVVISTSTKRSEVSRSANGAWVQTPVKAHLVNGAVVTFRDGAWVWKDSVVGQGRHHDALRELSRDARHVMMDSVIGLEAFQRETNPGRTLAYSAVTVAVTGALATIGTAVLLVVIFGSCPTIYADSAGVPSLQAEAFSYSIAPLLAKRDVDRLDVRADAHGNVRLEIRNEALETHYIDQLELLEARHDRDEFLLPAARAGLVAVRNLNPVGSVHDARGRNVARQVARADGVAFASDDRLLADAAEGRVAAEDYLDIVVPRAVGQDSLALVLKMRSSLLSTTIFYEHMLARSGARSLDWIGSDLSHITKVAQVAKWYTDNFGLRVLVRDGERWRPVVRLMDFGPVAWRNVAAIVANLPAGDSVRLRLAFAPDEWRIDRIAVAWQSDVRRIEPRIVPLARVTSSEGADRADALDYLRKADDRQLVTQPSNRFFAHFHVGPETGQDRTFLIAADGYYVEWVRPSWIRSATDSLPFSPRTSKSEILRSWRASKDSLESRFFRDRVPVL